MNKNAFFVSLDFFSLDICFGGFFHGATSAVFRMPLCHFVAIFTHWLVSSLRPSYPSTVNYRVAILAKSNSVRNFVAQFWKILPSLDVMGVDKSSFSTLLTRKIIPFVNRSYPFFIFISVSLVSCRLLRCFVFATTRAVFSCVSMVSNLVLFFAPLANKNRVRMINYITVVGAKSFVLSKIPFFANFTGFVFSMCWHVLIIPRLERMATAFPDLDIHLITDGH